MERIAAMIRASITIMAAGLSQFRFARPLSIGFDYLSVMPLSPRLRFG
jgi:hypothetical protein